MPKPIPIDGCLDEDVPPTPSLESLAYDFQLPDDFASDEDADDLVDLAARVFSPAAPVRRLLDPETCHAASRPAP